MENYPYENYLHGTVHVTCTRLEHFLGKKFADINGYTIDAEQEAYSIGLGNLFGKGVSDFIYLSNIHTLTVY